LERIYAIRIDGAQHLADAVADQRKHTARSLRRFSRQIKEQPNQQEHHSTEVRRLIHELSNWPALTAENLHDFRIKVKELRYVLQLAEDTSPKFVKALDTVKSCIGDWHDWLEMDRIAHEVLDPRKDSQALKKISEIEMQKLERALKIAQSLRARYLKAHTSHAVAEP
jgi:CHAD domain-containing protein